MWKKLKLLKNLLTLRPTSLISIKTIDFTRPSREYWDSFDYGENYDARFTIKTRGYICVGDEILIRLRSGRIGRYALFSVQRDFTGQADYKVHAMAIGYESTPIRVKAINVTSRPVVRPILALPAPKIKALLGEGSRGIRSSDSRLPDISDGTIIPASELWKVHARNEACGSRTNPLRATDHM